MYRASAGRRTRHLLAICTSGAIFTALSVAASPAWAATTTFGADLVGPADNTATCATANWYPAGGQPSCTFYSAAPGPSFYAPARGTVTTVRVKTGPQTGPMQVVVLYSSELQHPDSRHQRQQQLLCRLRSRTHPGERPAPGLGLDRWQHGPHRHERGP